MAESENQEAGMPDPTRVVHTAHMSPTRMLWSVQHQFLAEAERFLFTWVRRRREAMQSALHVNRHMFDTGMRDPVFGMNMMTIWHGESVQILWDDATEWIEMTERCADIVLGNSAPEMEGEVEPAPVASTPLIVVGGPKSNGVAMRDMTT